jgi:hypothetical protein
MLARFHNVLTLYRTLHCAGFNRKGFVGPSFGFLCGAQLVYLSGTRMEHLHSTVRDSTVRDSTVRDSTGTIQYCTPSASAGRCGKVLVGWPRFPGLYGNNLRRLSKIRTPLPHHHPAR